MTDNTHPGEPERHLLMAMLRQAIVDLSDPVAHTRADARAWLHSDTEEEFGFVWVCHHLKIPVGKTRERIELDTERMLDALER